MAVESAIQANWIAAQGDLTCISLIRSTDVRHRAGKLFDSLGLIEDKTACCGDMFCCCRS